MFGHARIQKIQTGEAGGADNILFRFFFVFFKPSSFFPRGPYGPDVLTGFFGAQNGKAEEPV